MVQGGSVGHQDYKENKRDKREVPFYFSGECFP